jgi:DnaJ-class molecular chaperone
MENKYYSDCCGEYCKQDAKFCPSCKKECSVINETETFVEIVEEDGEKICYMCSGSGEGMYDGSRCRNCKGSGVIIDIIDRDAD